MKLPNVELAVVPAEKIVGYLLNPLHPDGAGKAKWFGSLGFSADRWQILAAAIRQVAMDHSVANNVESPHGMKYIVDGPIESPSGKPAIVRTVWIVDLGEQVPRLVTAYPGDKGA